MEQIFQTVDEGGQRSWRATISSSQSLIDIPGLAKRLGTTVRHVRRLVSGKTRSVPKSRWTDPLRSVRHCPRGSRATECSPPNRRIVVGDRAST